MPRINLVNDVQIERTGRVMQLEGIFDIPPTQRSQETYAFDFDLPESWAIGLIVGPSGSGKTSVARHLFGDAFAPDWPWDGSKSIVDSFPRGMSIKEIVELLSSIGFSSPPSWLRPYHVLSNGEQFRVTVARTLAEMTDIAVIDEFTSVVDRTVAQIASNAIQKLARKRQQKLVCVSCHYDVIEWLQPDWIFQPHTGELLVGRSLHRRPPINLAIRRVHHSAWKLFRKHHYLDTGLNTAAMCFCAFIDQIPVAFSAWLHFPHPRVKNMKREHRTVVLPDYQGAGISSAFTDYICGAFKALGYRATSATSHPSMIAARNKSKTWKMTSQSQLHSKGGPRGNDMLRTVSTKRLTASFEYAGPALDITLARPLITGLTPRLDTSTHEIAF